jgi:carbon-monoxide dehydrogenase small subunit
MQVALTVNGHEATADVEPRLLLVHYLREGLGLTGTNIGCDSGSCGACTVHLDGQAVKSCTLLAVQADGAAVVTIEGVAGDPLAERLLEAFSDRHALQCGYCTPGMVMAALDLIGREADLTPDAVADGLEGNLCRCTGYHGIVAAIRDAGGGAAAGAQPGAGG